MLLTRIVLVRFLIVFVGWREFNFAFHERGSYEFDVCSSWLDLANLLLEASHLEGLLITLVGSKSCI